MDHYAFNANASPIAYTYSQEIHNLQSAAWSAKGHGDVAISKYTLAMKSHEAATIRKVVYTWPL